LSHGEQKTKPSFELKPRLTIETLDREKCFLQCCYRVVNVLLIKPCKHCCFLHVSTEL